VSSAVPYPVAARELLRNSLFDAAIRELEAGPWARVTMGGVAAAAGVSRQTLYKEFGSREAFVQALVLREVDRFLDPIAPILAARRDDPRAAIAQALEAFFITAATHPLVRTAIAGEGSEELLPLFTTRGGAVVHHAVGRLTATLLENWPHVPPADAELFAECMVRLAVSLAALPESPSAISAPAIAEVFGPYVEHMTGAGAAGALGP